MNKALRDRLKIPTNPLKLSEAQMQRGIVRELKLHEREFPALRYVIHIPNEGKRSNIGGKLAKDGGLEPGVPDFVSLSSELVVALELKANDNKPSPAQSWWLSELRNQGRAVGLAYNIDEAVEFFLDEAGQSPRTIRSVDGLTIAYWRAREWVRYLAETGQALTDPRLADTDKQRAW